MKSTQALFLAFTGIYASSVDSTASLPTMACAPNTNQLDYMFEFPELKLNRTSKELSLTVVNKYTNYTTQCTGLLNSYEWNEWQPCQNPPGQPPTYYKRQDHQSYPDQELQISQTWMCDKNWNSTLLPNNAGSARTVTASGWATVRLCHAEDNPTGYFHICTDWDTTMSASLRFHPTLPPACPAVGSEMTWSVREFVIGSRWHLLPTMGWIPQWVYGHRVSFMAKDTVNEWEPRCEGAFLETSPGREIDLSNHFFPCAINEDRIVGRVEQEEAPDRTFVFDFDRTRVLQIKETARCTDAMGQIRNFTSSGALILGNDILNCTGSKSDDKTSSIECGPASFTVQGYVESVG